MTDATVCCYARYIAGSIEVHHLDEGPYPVLVVHPGVNLVVNGTNCTDEISVKKGDTISVTLLEAYSPGKWSLWVSPNSLAAYIRLEPGKKIKRTLPDLPLAERLHLAPLEEVEAVPPVDLNALTTLLAVERILPQADMSVLPLLAATTTPGQYLIASGTSPTPGTDAEVSLLFEVEQKTEKNYGDHQNVDFRARFEFTSVKEGQVLLKKRPAVPGLPGMGVRGEPILPPAPKDITLAAGPGVQHQEGAQQLLATKSGRPVLRRSGPTIAVEIIPEMTIKGSVDLKTGNISFVGDVAVSEDVTAGFSIWSGRQVRVGGVIESARVQALTALIAKGNIIASEIQVGPPLDFVRQVRSMLPGLINDANPLVAAVQQLKSRLPQEKKRFEAQLITGLLNQRGDEVEERVKKLHAQLAGLDARLLDIYGNTPAKAIDMLQNTKKLPQTEEELTALVRVFMNLTEKFFSISPERAEFTAHNVFNSQVTCTGTVTILGGAYSSRILAGEKVTLNGVFRGGDMRAGGDVAVRELGSESSVPTTVTVPTSAKVKIGVAWENATVIIGPRRYRFDKKQVGVTMCLEEGNLIMR